MVGSPFTSSQTGTSSTIARSAMWPPRFCEVRGVEAGSGPAAVFGVEMRLLLHLDRVEHHAAGQAGRQSLPHKNRHGLAGGDRLSRREFRNLLVDVPSVESAHDFLVE